jgi:hypothetical protein
MIISSHMSFASRWRNANLAQNNYSCRATVNAQRTTRANIIVNNKHNLV